MDRHTSRRGTSSLAFARSGLSFSRRDCRMSRCGANPDPPPQALMVNRPFMTNTCVVTLTGSAVLIDLDGTLIDSWKAVERAYATLANEFSLDLDETLATVP